MNDDRTKFELLAPGDELAFDELYQIYLEAIAASERKTREALREMLTRPGYAFVVARQHRRVIGLAIVYSCANAGVALLEYFAVEAAQRGRGIGAKFFDEAVKLSRVARGEFPLLLEVESDRAAGAEQAIRARRIQFYRQLGCRRIEGLAYLLPLDVAGCPPPMDLLVHAEVKPDRLPRATIRDWLIAIYTDVYGRPADDPRIARMLAGLPDGVEVR